MDSPEHPSARSAPQVGALAPSFTLPDDNQRQHSLEEELRDGKPIVLFFMRGEW